MTLKWLFGGGVAIACAVLTILGIRIVRDDRTTFVAETLYWFALCFGLLTLVVLLPLGWIAWERRDSGPVVVTSMLSGYAVTAVFLGWFAYMFVPAVYTRDHRWSAPPHSNSLGAIHAEQLDRAGIPEAIAPEHAPAIRMLVREERHAFQIIWLRLSAIGLILPAILLLARTYWAGRSQRG